MMRTGGFIEHGLAEGIACKQFAAEFQAVIFAGKLLIAAAGSFPGGNLTYAGHLCRQTHEKRQRCFDFEFDEWHSPNPETWPASVFQRLHEL